MTKSLEEIPFLNDLGEKELQQLLAHKSSDPEFRRNLEAWSLFLEKVLGDSIDFFDNRSILVCHVLRESGFGELLNSEELHTLNEYSPRLTRALKESASLRAIEHRISREVVDFKEAWLIHEGTEDKTTILESHEILELSKWQPVSQSRRSSWKLLAAGFAVVFASIFAIQNLEENHPTILSAENVIENVSLPDGSTVRLLPGSILRYHETADGEFERKVQLTEGKAFFDIVKSTNPFTISTPNAEAIVLGTSFGMEANRYFTEVVLAEGSVVLADANDGSDKVILEPGQMSRVTSEGEVSRPHRVDVVDALHWTEMFIFRSTEMGDAMNRIAEHFGIEIETDETLSPLKINATYDYSVGVDYIVETISESLGADVLRTTKGFKLTK